MLFHHLIAKLLVTVKQGGGYQQILVLWISGTSNMHECYFTVLSQSPLLMSPSKHALKAVMQLQCSRKIILYYLHVEDRGTHTHNTHNTHTDTERKTEKERDRERGREKTHKSRKKKSEQATHVSQLEQ